MYLQTARFLLKSLAAAQQVAPGAASGSAGYLAAAAAGSGSARCAVQGEACWTDPQQALAALRCVPSLGPAQSARRWGLSARFPAGCLESTVSLRAPWQRALRQPVRAPLLRRHVAGQLVLGAADALRAAGDGRVVFEGGPWNSTTVELIRLARVRSPRAVDLGVWACEWEQRTACPSRDGAY
jgi:hypothetical protein